MKKRILNIMICVSLICGLLFSSVIQSYASAKDYAAYDCVAYVKARFQEYYGVTLHNTGGGNAKGYYYNAAQFGDSVSPIPMAGTLAVWDDNTNDFGHVAFVEWVSGTSVHYSEGGYDGGFHEETRELSNMTKYLKNNRVQTFLGFVYVGGGSSPHTHNYTTYVYNWKAHPHYMCYQCSCGDIKEDRNKPTYLDSCSECNGVSNPWISIEKNLIEKGSTVRFNVGADNATGYTIGIDTNSTRIITQDIGTSVSYTFNQLGNYSAYVTCYNSNSSMDSAKVWFDVVERANLDDDFYAAITTAAKGVTVGEYKENVQLTNGNTEACNYWHFKKQSDGTYVILNCDSGNALDVYNGGTSDSTNVCTSAYNGTDAQKWYIYQRGTGEYIFKSKLCDKVLDICAGSISIGTNIQIFKYKVSEAQLFKITKLKAVTTPILSVGDGETGSDKVFSWTPSENISYYKVVVNRGTPGCVKTVCTYSGTKDTTLKLNLSMGYHEVYVEAHNDFSTAKSNTVSFEINNSYNYRLLEDGTAELYDYKDTSPDAVIPTTIDGYTVSKINGTFSNDSYVQNITISETVTSIGNRTFCYCQKLNSLVIPGNVKEIGSDVAEGCLYLSEITLEEGITDIADEAFYQCKMVTNITIPKSVKSIGKEAFGYYYGSGQREKIKDFTIYGYIGTAAEKYAYDNGFAFIPLDSVLTVGDVDLDGVISVADATLLQKHIVEIKTLALKSVQAGDCDGDDLLSIQDVTYIQKYIAELSDIGNVGKKITPVSKPEHTLPEPTAPFVTTEPTTKPTEPVSSYTITFKNNCNWSNPMCYYWADNNTYMSSWPGVSMTYSYTDNNGYAVYTIKIPSTAQYVIFNNGGSTQTVDIPISGDTKFYISNTNSYLYSVSTW